MRSRRYSRNYRNFRNSRRNNMKLSLTPVVVILCLSVGCGYATARYVVDPVVNYVPTLTAEEEKGETDQSEAAITEAEGESVAGAETETKNQNADTVEDDVNVTEIREVSGYALQFGCYSGEAVAKAAMKSIGAEGLRIIEQDGMYKIIGETYDTKEKAAAALAEQPDTADAFVTTIYK